MILDTSFLLDVARNDPEAVSRAHQLETDGTPQRLAGITVYELYFGVGYSDSPAEERRTVENLIETRTVHETDETVMRKAGRVGGELAARGDPLDDVADLLVGATGIVHDEPVLTRNEDDFDRIDGLDVERY